MQCAGQRMTMEDRLELEHNIKELEIKIDKYGHDEDGKLLPEAMVWSRRLRRLRRMRE